MEDLILLVWGEKHIKACSRMNKVQCIMYPPSIPGFVSSSDERATIALAGGASGPEGSLGWAEQDLGADRGTEGEAMAVCGPEEDQTGSGCTAGPAQGIPCQAQAVCLIWVCTVTAQELYQGMDLVWTVSFLIYTFKCCLTNVLCKKDVVFTCTSY